MSEATPLDALSFTVSGRISRPCAEVYEAVADPAERAELEAQLLAQMYERGRAVNAAAVVELDDVIDPVDTRQWITTALGEVDQTDVPRGYVDTW